MLHSFDVQWIIVVRCTISILQGSSSCIAINLFIFGKVRCPLNRCTLYPSFSRECCLIWLFPIRRGLGICADASLSLSLSFTPPAVNTQSRSANKQRTTMNAWIPTHSDAGPKGEFYVMIHFLESVRAISRKESPSYFDRDRLHASGISAKRGKIEKETVM